MIQGLKMPGRPPHLPEFLNPPVSEVAIGVQFRPPLGYQQIRAGEVWNLYRSDYPNAEEQSPLPPAFETFGPPRSQSQPPINFVSGATHDRFWFISESGAELIQFQDDRLMHNWREMGLPDNPYPRFEQMIAKFEAELTELGRYIKGLAPQDLQINQCEVTYINTIKVDELPDSRPSTWLRGLEMPTGAVEDFQYVFRRTIRDAKGHPSGRRTCEAVSAHTRDLEPVIRLTITARGAPPSSKISDAITYLKQGRDLIVLGFVEFTTDAAQAHWGRVK